MPHIQTWLSQLKVKACATRDGESHATNDAKAHVAAFENVSHNQDKIICSERKPIIDSDFTLCRRSP